MTTASFCPHCGTTNLPGRVVCSTCGRALTTAPPTPFGLINTNRLLMQRYQILEKVGQGGFAVVYKARDIQLSSAMRAIKEMDEQQLTPQERQEAISAIDREALILSQLMHPNLPRIYDHFEEQHRWYLVMDYIEGETLESILQKSPEGKLPVDQVIQYGLRLCEVLKYLHSKEPPIIFRDLKPANIMITPEDHLYLIDFGIARFFQPGKGKDTTALGSPGYAAPEQYGKGTTPQADIYSLGATLHHLLSGRDPSDEPFLFPSLQFEQHDSVTQALADLVEQMVSMNKQRRPASIQEIHQTLLIISRQQMCQIPTSLPPFPTNKPPSATPVIPINCPGSEKWIFSTGQVVNSSPRVVNNVVYFGSHDGNLYALETSAGHKKWAFQTREGIRSTPTVVNNTLYFGSRDKNLYAISLYSGAKFWSFPSYNIMHSSPFYFRNVIYVGSDDYNLYALNAITGRKIWSFLTGDRVLSSPTVVNGIVYFGSYDGNLYALDAASGQEIWSYLTEGPIRSSPTVFNGVVYFGSSDHRFYALDANAGKLIWSFLTGDKTTTSPRVVNGIVYFGSYDGHLYALDTGSGQKVWSFHTDHAVRSSPAVSNGVVYFGSDDHNLYALYAISGRKIWSFQTGGRVQSSPAVANGIVYVGSDDGNLYAIFA